MNVMSVYKKLDKSDTFYKLSPRPQSDLKPWFLDELVAHFTMRTYGVNLVFRIDKGILVTSKQSSNPVFFRKRPILRAQHVLNYHLI